MERALFLKYQETLTDEGIFLSNEVVPTSNDENVLEKLNDMALLREIMENCDDFSRRAIEQEYGSTAAYWAI